MQELQKKFEAVLADRQDITNRLASSAHRDTVITRDYGCYDPLEVDLASCDCDEVPTVKQVGKRWVAICQTCGHKPTKLYTRKWSAALGWNIAQSHKLTYKSVIHFDLPYRDVAQSKLRLESILVDLKLKCDLAALEYRLSLVDPKIKAPGARYHDRLRAYKKWAELGLVLIERELMAGGD